MNNKKLIAILTLVCFMFTLMPVAAFAEESNIYADYTVKNVASQEELNAAVADAANKTKIVLADGTYIPPMSTSVASMIDKDIVFAGTQETILDYTSMQHGYVNNMSNATLTFDGVTVNWCATENYQGLKNAAKVVYRNCTINGLQFMYGDAEFINCTFNNKDCWSVWTYTATKVDFTDCTFNTGGHAVLIYNEATTSNFVANITMNNCTFNNDGTVSEPWGHEDLVETGTNAPNQEGSNKYYLTFTDCKIVGSDKQNLWGNKNDMDAEHLKVVVTNKITVDVTTKTEGDSGEGTDDSTTPAVNTASITLQQETAASIGGKEANLEIAADAATVTLDSSALTAIGEAATEEAPAIIVIASAEPITFANETSKAAVEITVTINGEPVLSEDKKVDTEIIITIQTDLLEGTTAYVYYVTDDGELTECQEVKVGKNGLVTFTTSHLSTYAVFGEKVTELETESKTDSTTSSGGGFSGTYNYPVSAGDVEGAKVTFSDNNAVAGETVTITVTPDSGKQVDEVIVTDKKGNVITVSKVGDNQYSFTMPAGKVNVAVTTKAISYDNKIVLQIGNQNVVVDGKATRNDVAPVIQGDRTLVPIRVIVEALGGDVDWNEATRTVTLTIDGKVLTLVIDEEIPGFGQGATIMDSRTYVPIRYVAEYIGAHVDWIAETQQIVILK